MKSYLPNDIKDQNRKIIFDILMQETELAKVEVTERTTMSFVTVSKIMDYFEQIGIVTISGESRDGSGGLGRKRVIYRFNPNRYLTVGVQVIGNEVYAVLLNLHSQIVSTYELEHEVLFYQEEFAFEIKKIVDYFQEKAEKLGSTIISVGIGIDGAINVRNKTIRMRNADFNEEDYNYEEILKKLKSKIGLPFVLENDVNASTVAEYNFLDRLGDGPNDLLQISVGKGIGAGIILDRKLYRGHLSGVGELEYMCFDTNHIQNPSSIGWLESMLNLDSLIKKFGYDIQNPESMSKENKENSITYISKYLALVICNVLSLLDIEVVILSGQTILPFKEEILSQTNLYLKQYTGWELMLDVSEKSDSTAIGAAIKALESEMTNIISG